MSETKDLQSIWFSEQDAKVSIIDQRHLPHLLVVEEIESVAAMCTAIREMHLRGAPLIGVAAAYGMYLACREAGKFGSRGRLEEAAKRLLATRPTAVNLAWAVQRQLDGLAGIEDPLQWPATALAAAREIEAEDIERCRRIGEHGIALIEEIYNQTRSRVNVLTHCNAGWLACVRHGTATAPIYAAHHRGIPVHVWVDETRPRNQGARLTAWELGQARVPHTVIVDNAGGHLLQHGKVDLVMVGSDRTTRTGDVANKIGTYLKALAANDNGIPFYVALPSSTIDWNLRDGVAEIPIEERNAEEVSFVRGLPRDGREIAEVRILPEESPAANYAFDVTPARLITALITERGICPATEQGIAALFS
ncbi:MAG: S-methyl-5-thioribose-1-phosphate isomerase [Spirochaetaceae bacterium]|nr:MAG: S-methyl-5-thioribose-1-phosphate isomerase [Spirochaetaceae bacterium]